MLLILIQIWYITQTYQQTDSCRLPIYIFMIHTINLVLALNIFWFCTLFTSLCCHGLFLMPLFIFALFPLCIPTAAQHFPSGWIQFYLFLLSLRLLLYPWGHHHPLVCKMLYNCKCLVHFNVLKMYEYLICVWKQMQNSYVCISMCANYHPYAPMYHNGCVSDSVFRDDHAVTVFVPLWRLVLHIRDGDWQLHWTAPVPSVRSHNFPGDVRPLWQKVTD